MPGNSTERSTAPPSRPFAAAQARTGSLSPERLRQVLDRLQEGFYDRPEILGRVAERLAGEPDASV